MNLKGLSQEQQVRQGQTLRRAGWGLSGGSHGVFQSGKPSETQVLLAVTPQQGLAAGYPSAGVTSLRSFIAP